MTSRDHVRRTLEPRDRPQGRRLAAVDAEDDGVVVGLPSLPERLRSARERKGVDLARAERDTKIRSHYLSALERGDYRELPAAVYTKGFLRNYAIYLGLDPEDVLRQWRRERGDEAAPDVEIVPPRPVEAPPRPLVLSTRVVVAAIMTFGVVLFGVYLAVQLLRFAKPPTLAVTRPAEAVVQVDDSATTYHLEGTATPGVTIVVAAAGRDQPYRVTADSDGNWSVDVDLRRGKNTFEISATDPDTGKQAQTPRTVVISVPYLTIQAPTLEVSQPVDGTTYSNGAIPIEGKVTNAVSVSVTATYLGVPGSTATLPPATPEPSLPPAGASHAPAASAAPAGSPAPGASGAPGSTDIAVADDGSFTSPLELTSGRWAVTITAVSAQGKTASLTRTITVAYSGVNVVVTISGGDAWLKVWVDGILSPTTGIGNIYHAGQTLTFSGTQSVEVRTGWAGNTFFTVNGVSLGALGGAGVTQTWLFTPTSPPQLTQRR